MVTSQTRDTELIELARACGLDQWVPGDLFPGRSVPFWAISAIARLEARNALERNRIGPNRWKYRLADRAAAA